MCDIYEAECGRGRGCRSSVCVGGHEHAGASWRRERRLKEDSISVDSRKRNSGRMEALVRVLEDKIRRREEEGKRK